METVAVVVGVLTLALMALDLVPKLFKRYFGGHRSP